MYLDYYATLEPNGFYHIFNRGNNRENLFFSDENCRYFLEKYGKYMNVLLDTYAYALLPNHFHLVVRARTEEEVVAGIAQRDVEKTQMGAAARRLYSNFPSLRDLESLNTNDAISEAFRRFFMAYAKAINKQEDRVGSLFQKNFRRLALRSDEHFTNGICYVHTNPQLHGICPDFEAWPHTSYNSMLSDSPTRLQRAFVLDWFGGRDGFMEKHQSYLQGKLDDNFGIEEV